MRLRGARDGSVFLIGFMASGKSAVGRALARRLGRPFVDTDREVEREAGASIPGIFARRGGEKSFRALEAKAVSRAARGPAAVVSLGGGAVLRAGSVRAMRERGTVVYLDAPFLRLWARAKAAGLERRPLLAAEDDDAARERMRALLERRRPLYRRAAHMTVRSDAPAEAIAARIAKRLGVR